MTVVEHVSHDLLAGRHQAQRARGWHPEVMHRLAAQKLANRRAQHGAAIGAAGIRRWARALELQLPALAGRADRFAKRDRPAVTELPGPLAELVPAIVGRIGLMPSSSALPANTCANAGDATSAASMPNSDATSRECAISRGAHTGVGSTRECNAPCTCRRRDPSCGSMGSSCTKVLSKRRVCINRCSHFRSLQ